MLEEQQEAPVPWGVGEKRAVREAAVEGGEHMGLVGLGKDLEFDPE